MTEKDEYIKMILAVIPEKPGCYQYFDEKGTIIYVGKAKNLKRRVSSYFNKEHDSNKTRVLVKQIRDIKYFVVDTEEDALLLENNLIKQYAPFFNADFKDDKSYPFIALTTGDTFPAIKYTREKHKANTKYFGPYTDSRAARQLVDIARRVVPLCSHSCADWRRIQRLTESGSLDSFLGNAGIKPCFDYHVGLGPGACCGAITPEEYKNNVKRIERFLAGNHTEFVKELTEEMREAAADLDFELAGRLKTRIETINSLSDKQHAVLANNAFADVVGISREETIAAVHVLMVR